MNALVDEQVIGAQRRVATGVRIEWWYAACALRQVRRAFRKHQRALGYLAASSSTRGSTPFPVLHRRALDQRDMMHNLDRQVEVMKLKSKTRGPDTQLDELFQVPLDPCTRCWELQARQAMDRVAEGAACATIGI